MRVQGPRPKSGKLKLNLHGTILKGKINSFGPQKRCKEKSSWFEEPRCKLGPKVGSNSRIKFSSNESNLFSVLFYVWTLRVIKCVFIFLWMCFSEPLFVTFKYSQVWITLLNIAQLQMEKNHLLLEMSQKQNSLYITYMQVKSSNIMDLNKWNLFVFPLFIYLFLLLTFEIITVKI